MKKLVLPMHLRKSRNRNQHYVASLHVHYPESTLLLNNKNFREAEWK